MNWMHLFMAWLTFMQIVLVAIVNITLPRQGDRFFFVVEDLGEDMLSIGVMIV